MFTQHIWLTSPLAEHYADQLAKRVYFLSEEITDFTFLREAGHIRGIDITTQIPVSDEELTRKVHLFIANDLVPEQFILDKVVWRSKAQHEMQEDVYSRMVDTGLVYEAGEGQMGLGELFLGLMDYFDKSIRAIAVREFGAREYRYPTLIPTTVLAKCGYFASFPQYLMFVTRLHADIDTYTEFLEHVRNERDIKEFALNYCHNLDYCLPPTMCFHTYHQYSGLELPESAGTVVTSRGKSFRFESRYRKTLERLWDFTIREIVFLGPRDFVLDCRSSFMQKALAFIEGLGLMGYCEVANDPFFCHTDAAEKIWSQRLLELKYELRLNVAEDRTIAAGSFNFHERFFGENFSIRSRENDLAYTACVGFGLERLVYAFLCQYGLERTHWPDIITSNIKEMSDND